MSDEAPQQPRNICPICKKPRFSDECFAYHEKARAELKAKGKLDRGVEMSWGLPREPG